MGDGFNLVIFDAEVVHYVEESGKVHKVWNLIYDSIEQKVELNPKSVAHVKLIKKYTNAKAKAVIYLI